MKAEILAPAGNIDSLKAAVRCGTDAVYMGASSFNARRNAANFDALSLAEAVRYCHGRNVKVYVTLNTLIFNSEVRKFVSCLEEVIEAGPDYLIVQDLGALDIIRSVCSEIAICASTQMAICNAEGAKALEDLGIGQAVLARELTLEEISNIHSQTNIRLETFVHGAHCMSVSGICYFSSALGERSGNRGLCAQPCRMDFRCMGREYALSLKDLSFVSHIKELQDAGVSALKIEGRMKRPEYVAASVTAIRKALNDETPDMEDLKRVFSRSGFTDGYLVGKRSASMFGIRSTEDITASKETLGRMASLYRHEMQNIPVDMDITIDENIMSLTVSDGKHVITEERETVICDTGIINKDIVERSLRKTGNTPYFNNTINITLSQNLKIQSSAINALRKSALDTLLTENSCGIKYAYKPFAHNLQANKRNVTSTLRARFSKAEQVVFPEKFEKVILPFEEIIRHPQVLESCSSICAELPTVIWPFEEAGILENMQKLIDLGIKDVTAGNIGHVAFLSELGFHVHGESTLNITNAYALQYYEKNGLCDTVLSSELTLKQAESLKDNTPTGIFVYGRLPLMFFRACPSRTKNGCESCSGTSTVTDHMHNVFPILCHQKKYSVMHNSVPLYLGDIELPTMDFYELYFTTETKQEISSVLNSFANHDKLFIPYTRGHAINGVR